MSSREPVLLFIGVIRYSEITLQRCLKPDSNCAQNTNFRNFHFVDNSRIVRSKPCEICDL